MSDTDIALSDTDIALGVLAGYLKSLPNTETAGLTGVDVALGLAFRHPEYAQLLYKTISAFEGVEKRDFLVDDFVRRFPLTAETV